MSGNFGNLHYFSATLLVALTAASANGGVVSSSAPDTFLGAVGTASIQQFFATGSAGEEVSAMTLTPTLEQSGVVNGGFVPLIDVINFGPSDFLLEVARIDPDPSDRLLSLEITLATGSNSSLYDALNPETKNDTPDGFAVDTFVLQVGNPGLFQFPETGSGIDLPNELSAVTGSVTYTELNNSEETSQIEFEVQLYPTLENEFWMTFTTPIDRILDAKQLQLNLNVETVPEPGTLASFGSIFVIGCFGIRRRNGKAKKRSASNSQ